MLTIYVSPREIPITTTDGLQMTVKMVLVREACGFISLQDLEPPSDLKDVEIVLVRKFLRWKFRLPSDLKEAILNFLRLYHAKRYTEVDCYFFTNIVKGVETNKVPYMLKYWKTKPLPWILSVGSVVFFLSRENHFQHAAIYIGFGLYISIYGAGGDLEVATLKSMKHDYGAEEVVLAQPKKGTA